MENYRISPPVITKLEEGQIFVFGSNTSGRHGKGAAKTALKWGAKWGKGVGFSGSTYAIPTKGNDLRKSLSINQIRKYVDEFIEFAKTRKDLDFLVTEIGCGLAGYQPKDIAPLSKKTLELKNIYLPKRFLLINYADRYN